MDKAGVIGQVYLIHFEEKFHHAQRYLGWTQNHKARIKAHGSCGGSKLLRAVNKAGINYKVVRTWENVDRHFERKLKNRKNSSKICPVCREARKNGYRKYG